MFVYVYGFQLCQLSSNITQSNKHKIVILTGYLCLFRRQIKHEKASVSCITYGYCPSINCPGIRLIVSANLGKIPTYIKTSIINFLNEMGKFQTDVLVQRAFFPILPSVICNINRRFKSTKILFGKRREAYLN